MKDITKLIPLVLLICTSSPSAEELKERNEIAAQYKWDLTDMYASTKKWEADIIKYNTLLPEIESYNGRLGDDGETLLAAVQKMEEVEILISNVFVFAGLKSYEDMRDGENYANFSCAGTLLA